MVVAVEKLHLRIEKLLRKQHGERLFSCTSPDGERMLLFQVSGGFGDSDEERSVERLEKLGEILSALDAPSIPRVRGWSVKKRGIVEMATLDPSGVFIVELAEEGRLPLAQSVYLWEQLLSALAPLNDKGLVYMLSHWNRLQVDRRGRVLLPEAGLVELLSGHLRQELSYSGLLYQRLLMDPELVPPELLRMNTPTPSADVFQSAVLFYRLVSGKSPYGTGMSLEIYNRAMNNQVVPLVQVAREVPEALSNLVTVCLSADPARRPANAAELKGRLISLRVKREGLAERLMKHSEKLYSSRFPGILSVHSGGASAVEELTDPSEIALREEEKNALLGELEQRLKSPSGGLSLKRRVLPWVLVGLLALLGVFALPTLLQLDTRVRRAPEGRLPEDGDGLTHKDSPFSMTPDTLLTAVPLTVKEKLAKLGISLAGEKVFSAPVLPPYRFKARQPGGYDVVVEFTSRHRLHSVEMPAPPDPEAVVRYLILYDATGHPVGIASQDRSGAIVKWEGVGKGGE